MKNVVEPLIRVVSPQKVANEYSQVKIVGGQHQTMWFLSDYEHLLDGESWNCAGNLDENNRKDVRLCVQWKFLIWMSQTQRFDAIWPTKVNEFRWSMVNFFFPETKWWCTHQESRRQAWGMFTNSIGTSGDVTCRFVFFFSCDCWSAGPLLIA